MLVFGDTVTLINPQALADRLNARAADSHPMARRGEWTSRLIEAGRYLQALEDHAACEDRLISIWRRCVRQLASGSTCVDVANAAAMPSLPARVPEGYAFYALYPECYVAAARSFGRKPRAFVIGLRSIGTSLAPVVAESLGASDCHTLRPSGPVFDRHVGSKNLATRLSLADPAPVCIVDEGPGLSGSSFAATARFVEKHAPQHRIHFFTSHANGPGHAASSAMRDLFNMIPQHHAGFETIIEPYLANWFKDITGEARAPLQDVSAGKWRALHFAEENNWPACNRMQERRKYLLHAESGLFLLRFLGLGESGETKHTLACQLSREKLCPELLAFRHGFSLERWHAAAKPVCLQQDRDALRHSMITYIAKRMQIHPLQNGATPDVLAEMTATNTRLAAGPAVANLVLRRLAPLHTRDLRSICASDNRMHLHEWLKMPDGHIFKTDALDHHAGHDLVGAQDASYDIAAASLLLALDKSETDAFAIAVAARAQKPVRTDLVAPMRLVWLAFEIGHLTMAAESEHEASETSRLLKRIEVLHRVLLLELETGPAARGELQRLMLVSPP